MLSSGRRPRAFALPLAFLLATVLTLAPSVPAAAGTCGIFVSGSTGTDGPTTGLSPQDPCATISYGISRAQAEGLDCVFVQANVYGEVVTLADGISVIGGFDANWEYDTYSAAGHGVLIAGGLDGATQQYMSVKASGLTSATTVSNLLISGPDALGDVSGRGRSSFAVYVSSSIGLALTDLSIEAGNGAPGVAGDAGDDASTISATAGMLGGIGQNGQEFSTSCNDTSHGNGGSGGTNPSAAGSAAGTGGDGGRMDADCGTFGCAIDGNCSATPGSPGFPAQTSGPGFGQAGAAGGPCSGGGGGGTGRIINGSSGTGGITGGALLGNAWYGNSGLPGSIGSHGGGGGGGGGAGGCDTGIDEFGAGGGGGGAGGQRAIGGGGAGGGGGGSFGVFVLSSSIDVTNCGITRAAGGAGGNGGSGGRGQDGGNGGPGGNGFDSGPGGTGGKGGHGGHGGGGGGGAGGDSWGIWANASTVNTALVNYGGGSAGAGGSGGISAPGAPVPVDDGNDGSPGADGTVGTMIVIPGPEPAPASIARGGVSCDVVDCGAVDAPLGGAVPAHFGFHGLRPNPAGASSAFAFALPAPTAVRLDVYDVSGRCVGTIVDRTFAAGEHRLAWDGRIAGTRLGSGVYWARLTAGDEAVVRKIALLAP
jgi:hypothetical protein